MRYLTALREPVQTEQCAKIFQVPTTLNVFVGMDLREKTVILLKTLAPKMVIHVTMEQSAEPYLRVGIHANALKDGLELTARKTLMTVWNSHVF
jgi:hypothetical protein